MKNLFIILLVFVLSELHAQSPDSSSILQRWKNIEVQSPDIANAFWRAFQYYPEFEQLHIWVKKGKTKTSMSCRPTVASFFSKKRQYVIIVNQNTHKPMCPIHGSLGSMTGCFGHELAHIVRYERQKNLEILKDAWAFVTRPLFRSRYEKETDEITIKHGLGQDLLKFSNFIFHNNDISRKYLEFKKKYYYTPSQLQVLVDEFENQ